MKGLENNKKIIEDALEIIYNKFNVESLNQISDSINVEYFTSAIKSLEEIEINPVTYIKNLEAIIKDIENQINEERSKENPNEEEIERLKTTYVGCSEKVQSFLSEVGTTVLKSGVPLCDLICRPELDYFAIAPIDENRPDLSYEVCEQVNINVKYEGYIAKQIKQVEAFKKMENKLIPKDIDYKSIKGLRLEAGQKLDMFKPTSIGQASRISGVSPADISVLLVYISILKNE